jgi:cytochrome c-type biogenesis protein CcmH
VTYSRRAFLATAVGFTAAQAAQDPRPNVLPPGQLYDPTRAGRPMEPTRPQDNDAEIQAIEKRLKCQCGCNLDVYTCRTTDFTCEVSPAMHREVVALYDSGQTARQIVDDFVRRHGVAILMAPPKRGFNLAGYFVPSLAILAAAAILVVVLRRWTRGATPAVAAATPDPAASASPQELDRLRQELERFPG